MPSTTERLARCEVAIQAGRKATLAMAKALREIRDDRLYKPEHDTFESYCRHRWGWSRARAYQIIEWAEVADSLPGEMSNNLTPAQASALHDVPPDLRLDVLQEAKETAPRNKRGEPKATRQHLANTAARMIPAAGETVDILDPDYWPIDDAKPAAEQEPIAEPNTIGETIEDIDSSLERWFDGKPPHIKAHLLNHIRERLDEIT